ncbi:fimbria/pilus outer membrane usher protein [Burkholderia cepacia]|uniref:fimbria/pilus outer membrane usher protein n=2 Tax=Burkholderiaceae TaxID=119060 RepID=UPI001588F6A6|nr:fimbria/pilus outer membrane usher protein [Burkholderia cepacia]MCA8053479.1 fimbrial biogenesis outer membrane usher protein [Burkholderia cepacia]MCA8132215.1 fimbrial biogenesis outer membrane usher protein [Burkholderia cepacia]HEM7891539.1 fimbrial biogenesis outer membrane usher protein [Burkholderia cepacia]HEM8510649.1 fimbrial biogenesis outer membrane usher protein [Burkholderia cepacia]
MIEKRQPRMQAETEPKLKPVCALLLTIIAGWQTHAYAAQTDSGELQIARTEFAQVEFEGGFLNNGSGAIDVSRYERRNVVRAGMYKPDVYVDGDWIGRIELQFKSAPNTVDAQPCFDKAQLELIGVDFSKLPQDVRATLDEDGACLRIGQAIQEASVSYDFNEQRLDLSIPQISMRRQARGYVSPDQWSEGIPVGMLDYNASVYHARTDGQGESTQGYVGVNGGVNVGRWHFRHNGSFNWDDRGRRKYENVATYLQRDLTAWSSQLIVGDAYTSGDLFDSTSFRGVRLYTDDRMLPESQRGYAPVVRGVANTHAKVTVTQNGATLYETTVAPGAFVIDDLYPTGYGGDLKVNVTEADGSVHSFTVPYAAVPLSLRPGQNRYSFTTGVVRNLPNTTPYFAQATWQRGVTNLLTGYGGVTFAQGYLSAMAGAVLNTSLGAVGVDVTHATTSIPGERRYSGQSFRISYAKAVAATGTNVAIAAYRYSTNGFFALNDAMQARDQAQLGAGAASVSRQRNRASLTVSQSLGARGGSLNATASASTYWNRSGSDVNFTVGYSNTFRDVAYSVSATRQRDAWGKSSTMYYANLSIPLGKTRPMTLATSLSRDTRGSTQAQTSLSGALGVDNNVSYGLNVNHGNSSGTSQTNGGASIQYRGPIAELSGSVSAGADYQQFSAGARGAIVAHRGGVTLSQPLSETFAIIEAPNAEGARVTNTSGVRIDRRGYAVVPYLTPFAMNDIGIDPKGLSTDVELKETSQRIAPLAGAVPMLTFKTAYGRSAVIRARQADGSPVPFGATVTDADGKDVGTVGQGGKLLARGLVDQGELKVQWEADRGKSVCALSYSLPVRKRAATYQSLQSLELPCVASEVTNYAPAVSNRVVSARR